MVSVQSPDEQTSDIVLLKDEKFSLFLIISGTASKSEGTLKMKKINVCHMNQTRSFQSALEYVANLNFTYSPSAYSPLMRPTLEVLEMLYLRSQVVRSCK